MFAGLFTEICPQKKAAAATVNAVLIFRPSNPEIHTKNNKTFNKPLYQLIVHLIKFNGRQTGFSNGYTG